MKTYLVTDFGSVADGVTLNSVPVQRAIDLCTAEGGEVVFSADQFVLATVF